MAGTQMKTGKAGPTFVGALKNNLVRLDRHRRQIMIGLLLPALIASPASPAMAVKIVHVRLLYRISSDFKEPSDVAVSKSGRIYVVDGVNNRIKLFEQGGDRIGEFGAAGSGDGQFSYPLGIDVDDAENIYVADAGNHRVQIFGPDTVFSAKIDLPVKDGKAADPTDVAVDGSRKRLYVVDNDNHRFLIYDLANLKLIKTVGEAGEDPLMFRYPFLAALNPQHILHIVDVINTRVQVVTEGGQFVRYIGGWGVENGHFFRPKGVAIDGDGRIYVSDSYMGVIQVFESQGGFYGVLGDTGNNQVRRFKTPIGMAIDANNRLYVVEMLAQQVSVYRIETGRQ